MSMDDLLEVHMRDDKEQFGRISDTLKTIQENHLHHIEKSVAAIEVSIDRLVEHAATMGKLVDANSKEIVSNTTNIDWLKWFIMTAVGAGLANLIVSLLRK